MNANLSKSFLSQAREETSKQSRIAPQAPVTVTKIEEEADGVLSISMVPDIGYSVPEWQPGAHIDLVINEQAGLVRQYSLCGDVTRQQELKIAVLREPDGRGGSEQIHTKLRVGDRLLIAGPRNNFPLVEAEQYRMIAGGIGITPILPMLRELERTRKQWSLIYGGRKRESMAFLDELAGYGNKVAVYPENQSGILDLEAYIGTPQRGTVVYVCGPEALISAVETLCQGWPEGALNLERFKPTDYTKAQDSDEEFEVVLQQSGVTITVTKEESIADAVEKAGFYIPRSCDEGTCGTCLTNVLEGVPDHRDSFLRGNQRTENKVMTVCCSRARTKRLVLDA